MPPRKRPAESAPEAERPAKRQTRSTGKATPVPLPARPATKARRAQPTTRKRATATEPDEDNTRIEANEDISPPVKPLTRIKSKAQLISESLLVDETNLVRDSAAVKSEPKPRRGRPPKKKDTEGHRGELQCRWRRIRCAKGSYSRRRPREFSNCRFRAK
jgi:hypothetical protein